MPVHGEWRHLKANADIAVRTGVAPDRVFVGDDGIVVDLVNGQAKVVGKVSAGYVYVSGATVGNVTEASLKDRRTLAAEGVITVVGILDSDTGQLVEPPDFLARGFAPGQEALEQAVPSIEKALARAAEEGVSDRERIEEIIVRAVAQWAWRSHRLNPIVMPVVIEE